MQLRRQLIYSAIRVMDVVYIQQNDRYKIQPKKTYNAEVVLPLVNPNAQRFSVFLRGMKKN